MPEPTKGMMEVQDYLLNHEGDIAWEINDFGCLRVAFTEIIEREPVKE